MFDPNTQHYVLNGFAFPAVFEHEMDTTRHLAHPLSHVVTGAFRSLCEQKELWILEEWNKAGMSDKVCSRCIRRAKEEVIIVQNGG